MAGTLEGRSPHFVMTSPRERARAAFAALGAVGVIALAAILVPDSRGLGTHEQLGLPPCMTMRLFGIPCPFCGMTTAFAHMAHGHLLEAFAVQPAGALAFFGAVGYALLNGFVACTARRPAAFENRSNRKKLVMIGTVIVAVAWVYKIVTVL